MSFIEYYIIFALTTSIFSLIDIFIPVLSEAIADNIKNVLTENPKLSCFVYFCLIVITAPLVILPMIVPSMNDRYRDSIAKIIKEQEKF
jgi:uncharacterized membrane protein YdjX (TVP38/TMEM64 family)